MSINNEFHRNYRKKSYKGIYLIICLVLIISIVLLAIFGAFGNKDKEGNSSINVSSEITNSETGVSSEISEQEVPSSHYSSLTSSKKPVSSTVSLNLSSSKASSVSTLSENLNAYVPNGDWRLIIANKQHPLPKSYVVNTAYVSGNYRVDSRIADSYKKMISAAKNDGITLVIISGFRTYSGQESLFNNKVNQYINKGYSRDKAKELAAQYVAPPGTSEHLTGLAVDLISTNWYSYNSDLNSNFENTKEFKWLYENCADYGFALRYPKDKVSITGYSYEPWHYRYVGVDAAKEIMGKKICLEEYVATLN